MIKPVYLDLSALEIRKIAMYEFWHDYIKKKKNTEKKQNYYTWIQPAL